MVRFNLYTLPSDVFDFMSIEGAQLRLDDRNLATLQTVTVTAAATLGATTLNITALSRPLLAGTVLEFDGGGNTGLIEVTLAATAGLGATTLTVNALPTAVPALASAVDNGENLVLAGRLVKGCQYGTGQVQLYCLARYDDGPLLQNANAKGSVNRWATALAARWVGRRCCRPCPQSILDEAEEALEELKQVQRSMLYIEQVPMRTSGWPFVSNITIDPSYTYAKARVEANLSELTPVLYPQYIDWNSYLTFEF